MILLSGARGVVGYPLTSLLEQKGLPLITISRQAHESTICWDLTTRPSRQTKESIRGCNTLIHCAPIWFLPNHLDLLLDVGIKRMIVFSSTSVISKQDSRSASERQLVKSLGDSEIAIREFACANKIECWILRPSMIYGYGRDENVTHIARFIRKWGLALSTWRGAGLRQPVHADDLVWCVLEILNRQNQDRQTTLTLAGGEVLDYKTMLKRIFKALGKPSRIIACPTPLLKVVLWILGLAGKFNYTADMAQRMNQALAYDNSPAFELLGYQPQAFLVDPERDLASN